MYSQLTLKDRIKVRSALAFTWFALAGAGFGGAFLTPQTVAAEQGDLIPIISSVVILIASLIGFFSSILNKWQIEWIASWFAAAGLIVYVSTIWFITFTTTPSRLQQAFVLTAAIGFILYRIAFCATHARKLRKEHYLKEYLK